GTTGSRARRKMTNRGIERAPSPLRTPQPPSRLAGRFGNRKKVTLAEIGVTPPLEFLVVASQRILFGEIGDDRLVGRRIDYRHDLYFLLLEAAERGAHVLVRQQVEVAVRGELSGEAAVQHLVLLLVVDAGHVERPDKGACFRHYEDVLSAARRKFLPQLPERRGIEHHLRIGSHQSPDG